MDLRKVKTVGIIGVGFMGGSLALALKNKYKNIEVIGYARSQKSFRRLKKFKGLDRVEKNLTEIAARADILALAAPVGAIIDSLKKISFSLKKGAVVFDLGSTKEEIERTARKFLAKKNFFVGCHPFCGSEKKGVEEARPGLYRGSVCFITSQNQASFLIEKLWEEIGSRVIRLSPAAHDKLTCAISHFPHLACFSLVNSVSDKHLKFSSSGFKDLTRIASSSEKLWSDIFLTNKDKLLEAIKNQVNSIKSFQEAIEKGDKQKIEKLIKKANQKRKKIL